MPQVTQAQIATLTPNFHSDIMREALWPSLMVRQFGTDVIIPHGRSSVKISRWTPVLNITNNVTTLNASLATITENITEGTLVTSGAPLSAGTISGSPVQFIGFRKYTDKLAAMTEGDFDTAAVESLVKEMGFRLDRWARTAIQDSARNLAIGNQPLGTVKLRTNPSSYRDVLTGRNQAMFQVLMDGMNNMRWDDGGYVVLTHPFATFDLTVDASGQSPGTAYVSVKQYGNPEDIYRGEIGWMFGCRIVSSTAIPKSYGTAALSASNGISPGASAFQSFVFAPDSFYNLLHEDGSLQVIHHPLGSGGATGDPGNQVGSIAAKVWYNALPNVDAATTTTFGGNSKILRVSHTSTLNKV